MTRGQGDKVDAASRRVSAATRQDVASSFSSPLVSLFPYPFVLLAVAFQSDLGLRPAPPPEAVPEHSLPWWPLLLLGFLGLLILFIRYRAKRPVLSHEEQLGKAISKAKESTTDISIRYLHLQKQLRAYLSSQIHQQWHSLTSKEVAEQWEQAFSGHDQDYAQQFTAAWKYAEFVQFGQGSIGEKELDQLIDLAKGVLTFLSSKKPIKSKKQRQGTWK